MDLDFDEALWAYPELRMFERITLEPLFVWNEGCF
jgi:hypothetical protein